MPMEIQKAVNAILLTMVISLGVFFALVAENQQKHLDLVNQENIQ